MAAVYSNDGKVIAIGSDDGVISLYDVERNAEIRQLYGHKK